MSTPSLEERLRGYANYINRVVAESGEPAPAGNADIQLLREAADALASLTKELEEAREALKPMVPLAERWNQPHAHYWHDEHSVSRDVGGRLTVGDIRRMAHVYDVLSRSVQERDPENVLQQKADGEDGQ